MAAQLKYESISLIFAAILDKGHMTPGAMVTYSARRVF